MKNKALIFVTSTDDTRPAAQVVVDKFHVMQYVYDAVGEVRLRIKKELSEGLPKSSIKPKRTNKYCPIWRCCVVAGICSANHSIYRVGRLKN